MLTHNSVIVAPQDHVATRASYVGSLEHAFNVDERMWDRLGELLYLCAPVDEDVADDRNLDESLEALGAHFSDDQLASELFDDPAARVIPENSALDAIVSATRDLRDVEERRLEAVRKAREAGYSITVIAKVAGVTRPTIYSWLN